MALVVKLNQGKVKGKENKSVLTGKSFYSFQGIPYAKPPLGELRFQAPQPPEKWEGIYDATYERDICTQIRFFETNLFVGSEDCLYLNIHIPEVPANIKTSKAVMIYIHGGGFCIGSSSEDICSPDFLIEKDVIIITFHYRLHALGFLNLGIPECPGNAGLKDQVQAIKWVKENIASFGGDPENITIFGESAGASSVHYLIISPLSKGLFKKAILQSGIANAAWALSSKPYEMAFKFGKLFGFKGEDKQELLDFLKQQDANDLANKTMELQNELLSLYPWCCSILAFAPSVEDIKDGAFLPELPDKLNETADPLPIIIGLNHKEGTLAFEIFSENILELLPNDLSTVLKNNFKFDPDLLPELSRKIKWHYFEDTEDGVEIVDKVANLFSDLFFYNFYEAVDNITKSSAPTYVYEFTYDGSLNFIKKFLKVYKQTNVKGAGHADELGYLFYPKRFLQSPSIKEDDLKVIENLTTLWSNFAKSGNPSNEFYWKPSTPTEPSYLRIDTDLKLMKGKVYQERLEFLKNLLDPVAKPI